MTVLLSLPVAERSSAQIREFAVVNVAAVQSLVAVLCVPAHFVPSDFLSATITIHDQIKAARLLRHCDDPKQFIILIDFQSQARTPRMRDLCIFELLFSALRTMRITSFESSTVDKSHHSKA
jgi:hypothetical protein